MIFILDCCCCCRWRCWLCHCIRLRVRVSACVALLAFRENEKEIINDINNSDVFVDFFSLLFPFLSKFFSSFFFFFNHIVVFVTVVGLRRVVVIQAVSHIVRRAKLLYRAKWARAHAQTAQLICVL